MFGNRKQLIRTDDAVTYLMPMSTGVLVKKTTAGSKRWR